MQNSRQKRIIQQNSKSNQMFFVLTKLLVSQTIMLSHCPAKVDIFYEKQKLIGLFSKKIIKNIISIKKRTKKHNKKQCI